MASKRELQALIVLAGKVDPSLQKALKAASKNTKNLSSEGSLLGKAMSKSFGLVTKVAKGGMVLLGAGMAAIGAKGLMLASDLTEVQNVVDVTFGDSASKINAWAKTAKNSYGLSELSAKQYTGTLGAMLKSTGISTKYLTDMSEGLAALSGDFSSFYNLSTDDAFEKIRSGISGETEPLKQLGINMSVANLQAFALSKGIKTAYDKMSEADKTILRYNYLMSVSKDAQGDFARTSTSFANQLRLLKVNFGEAAAKIMNSTVPAFSKLFQQGNKLITTFSDDQAQMDKLTGAVAGFVDKVIAFIPTAIKIIKNIGMVIWDVLQAAYRLYTFITENWSLFRPLLMGIVAAMLLWKGTLGVIAVYETITKAATIATEVFSAAKYKDAAASLYLQALYAKDAIVKGISTAATWAMTAATNAARIGILAAAAAQWALNAALLANPVTWIVVGIVAAIGVLVGAFYLLYKHWDTVSSFLSHSWDMIKAGFAAGINYIVDKINWLIKKMNKIPGVNIPLIPTMGDDGDKAVEMAQTRGSVPMYASGGFTNQPSIFGEAGPEAAIPLKRTPRSLGLLNQTAKAIGAEPGGGSPQFVFAPVINGGDSRTLPAALSSAADDFFAKCEEWWESKRRMSFG